VTPPTVLLVEADVLVRSPLADYLRECGYRVLEARDTAEARQLLGKPEEDVDVVLIEAQGQGETGFAFAAWIREHRPQTEVILTGAVEHATRKAADLCEDGPELRKPYDHRLVLDRIKRLIAARDRRGR
jgi:DNA-binding response OmpR family regulator